jgi:hypothetical protein
MSDVLSGLESRFLISLMMQPETFFHEDSNWSLLCKFLKLSSAQEQSVKALHRSMQVGGGGGEEGPFVINSSPLIQEKRRSEMHQKVLSSLQSATQESAVNCDVRWRSLCNILTPAQLVSLMEKNRVYLFFSPFFSLLSLSLEHS